MDAEMGKQRPKLHHGGYFGAAGFREICRGALLQLLFVVC